LGLLRRIRRLVGGLLRLRVGLRLLSELLQLLLQLVRLLLQLLLTSLLLCGLGVGVGRGLLHLTVERFLGLGELIGLLRHLGALWCALVLLGLRHLPQRIGGLLTGLLRLLRIPDLRLLRGLLSGLRRLLALLRGLLGLLLLSHRLTGLLRLVRGL